jgi:hypothetical protein
MIPVINFHRQGNDRHNAAPSMTRLCGHFGYQHAWLTIAATSCRSILDIRELCTLCTIACPGVCIGHGQPHGDGQLEINDLQIYHSLWSAYFAA